jgi:hypothetical protein
MFVLGWDGMAGNLTLTIAIYACILIGAYAILKGKRDPTEIEVGNMSISTRSVGVAVLFIGLLFFVYGVSLGYPPLELLRP